MGNFVMSSNRGQWVETFCGNEMLAWEEGERPPGSRVEDFCKNCFRRYAWQIMVDQVGAEADKDSLADRLDAFLEDTAIRTLSTAVFAEKIKNIVTDYRKEVEGTFIPPAPVEPPTMNVRQQA